MRTLPSRPSEGRLERIDIVIPADQGSRTIKVLLAEDLDLLRSALVSLLSDEDDRVRVVILSGLGPIFSSGHDLGSPQARDDQERRRSQPPESRPRTCPVAWSWSTWTCPVPTA